MSEATCSFVFINRHKARFPCQRPYGHRGAHSISRFREDRQAAAELCSDETHKGYGLAGCVDCSFQPTGHLGDDLAAYRNALASQTSSEKCERCSALIEIIAAKYPEIIYRSHTSEDAR